MTICGDMALAIKSTIISQYAIVLFDLPSYASNVLLKLNFIRKQGT